MSLDAYTPTPPDTTLATGISAASSSITLTSGAEFPNKGGLWIGPGDDDEAWGYVTYSAKTANTLTIASRDPITTEYLGTHAAGAIARFWWELDTATAEPIFTSTMDNNDAVVSWTLQLSGIVAPVPAMRTGMLFIRQRRSVTDVETEGGDTWDSWTTDLIGWVTGVSMRDDADKVRTWSMRVASADWVLNTLEIPGSHIGARKLDDRANITVSSTLPFPYLAANTGEFVGSSVVVSASAMVDGNTDTPWISAGYVGENNVFPTRLQVSAATNNGIEAGYGITQVHITKYPGQSNGYRWFEISFFEDTSEATNWVIAGLDYMFVLENFSGSNEERLIFAENPDLFAEEHPEHQASSVLDLGDYSLYDLGNKKFTVTNNASSGTFTLTVDVDTTAPIAYDATALTVQIALENLASVGDDNVVVMGQPQSWTVTFVNGLGSHLYSNFPNSYADMTADGSGLTGGTVNVISVHASSAPFIIDSGEQIFNYATYDGLDPAGGMIRTFRILGSYEQGQSIVVWGDWTTLAGFGWGPGWVGNPIAAMGTGQTARMIFFPGTTTSSDQYWEIGNIVTPGYNVVTATKEWVYYDLPTMGLSLASNLAADSGATTITVHKQNVDSVDGLPASGTIQVGIEQITYSTIDRATGTLSGGARARNGTTLAAHTTGDTVYFVDTGGVATEAFPIDKVYITRPTGFSTPADFTIYGSNLNTARKPSDDNFSTDYTVLASVTGNTDVTYELDLSSLPPRVRYLLVAITDVSDGPNRVKINELGVDVDTDVLNPDYYMAEGTVAATVTSLLTNAGIPAGAITDSGGTSTVSDFTTQPGLAWATISDLADFTGTRITIGRDSKITIAPDPWWSVEGIPAESSEITRAEASYVEVNKTPSLQVGQVELSWRAPGSDIENIAVFPGTYTFGRKVTLGPYVYADAAAACVGAAKRYYQLRRPYDIVAEMADESQDIDAGSIRGVNWKLHDQMLSQDRTYLVTRASHTIRENGWNTVLTLLQLDRTDEL